MQLANSPLTATLPNQIQTFVSRASRRSATPRGTAFATAILLASLFALPGCSQQSEGVAQPQSNISLFADRKISVRAVVVTRSQRSFPLESMEIHASPASAIAPLFKKAIEEHAERVASLVNEINRTRAAILQEEGRLLSAQADVAAGYNDALPSRGEVKPQTSRDDLESLLEARAKKSSAIDKYKKNVEVGIRPIEQSLAGLRSRSESLEAQLVTVRARYNNTLFESLPGRPAKNWVTDADGATAVTIPQTEPWYFWAATNRAVPGLGIESYRWILLAPDDLDENGKLFFDHRTLLENRGLTLDVPAGFFRKDGS